MSVVAKRKQNVSVTLEPLLVEQARDAGINFSRTLENAVRAELKNRQEDRWKKDNAEAIGDLNSFIAEHGHFSDQHRKF